MKEKRFKTVFCRCSYHTPYNPWGCDKKLRTPTKHGFISFFLYFFILWQTPVVTRTVARKTSMTGYMVTQNFLKSLVTTFNPQEHAKTPILSCTPEYRILPKLNIPLSCSHFHENRFYTQFSAQVEICMAVTSSVNTPSYTATSWLHLTHIDKDLHASAGQVGSVL